MDTDSETRRPSIVRTSASIAALATLALLVSGCIIDGGTGPGSNDGGNQKNSWHRDQLFTNTVSSVSLEVDYEQGAEPYTSFDSPTRSGSPWSMTRKNLDRMFRENGADVQVPTSTGGMEQVSTSPEPPYSSDDILDIATAHRDDSSTKSSRSFYILFLDGKYEDDSGTRDGVLGVSLGNTGVMAIFKPVVESTGNQGTVGSTTRRYVEQTTVVHEFGHAAGLVNNGLSMVEDHQDEDHGAHCDNDDCVMFWKNEGADNIGEFVRQYVVGGDKVVFGDQCLADVDSASGQ